MKKLLSSTLFLVSLCYYGQKKINMPKIDDKATAKRTFDLFSKKYGTQEKSHKRDSSKIDSTKKISPINRQNVIKSARKNTK